MHDNVKGNTDYLISLPVELMKELIFASLLPSEQNAQYKALAVSNGNIYEDTGN
jgi:hypothetical protein